MHLDVVIQANGVPFDDDSLATVRDLGKVRKAYKLSAPQSRGKRPGSESEVLNGNTDAGGDSELKEVEVAVLGAMALRGAV